MEMTKRAAGRVWLLGILVLAVVAGRAGAAFQRSPPTPAPAPDYSRQNGVNNSIPGRTTSLDDQSVMHELEEKRGRAMNSERQRLMVKDANQLVQTAAELQAEVTQGVDPAAREEQARRAELVEKLARNVKDRMRGNR